MDKVSIIIPVYNTEKYLGKCLESLKNQTHQNIELCITNDCSNDGCDRLIKSFMEHNPNMEIRYIQHENNEGSSGARNSSLKVASGDYIYMLDSDDYISPQTLEHAVKKIESEQCDICVWGFTSERADGSVLVKYTDMYSYYDGVLDGYEVWKRKVLRQMWVCTGNALFSRKLLEASAPLYFNTYDMGEDFYCISKLLLNSRRVCCVKEENFRCVSRDGSMTHSKFSPKNKDPFELFLRLKQFASCAELLTAEQKRECQEILDIEARRTYIEVINLAVRSFEMNTEVRINLEGIRYKHCKVNRKYYNIIMPKNYRQEYIVFRVCPQIYYMLYRWLYRRKRGG